RGAVAGVELVRESKAMERAHRHLGGFAADFAAVLAASALIVGVALGAPVRALADAAPGEGADSTGSVAPAAAPAGAPAPAAAAGSAFPRPVANAPLAAVHMVRLTGRPRTVLRSGPSESDAIAGVFPPGTSVPLLGRNGDWSNVGLTPTESAWVHASRCSRHE